MFALHKSYKAFDAEKKALMNYVVSGSLHDIRYFADVSKVPDDAIPFGSVKWVSANLSKHGINIVPDYYPDFLSNFLHRKTWYADTWPYATKCFIKSADTYKGITGFIKVPNSFKGKKRSCTRYACSESVKFEHEWRYYVNNSKIVGAYQYDDFDMELPAPTVDIDFPRSDWCGCIDFGVLDTGEIALVESQHPFACGWYGPVIDFKIYIDWIIAGWKFLIS